MTNESSSKISKHSIAVRLTICYWIATFPLTWFSVQHDPSWFTVVWFFAICLFFQGLDKWRPVTIFLRFTATRGCGPEPPRQQRPHARLEQSEPKSALLSFVQS